MEKIGLISNIITKIYIDNRFFTEFPRCGAKFSVSTLKYIYLGLYNYGKVFILWGTNFTDEGRGQEAEGTYVCNMVEASTYHQLQAYPFQRLWQGA
jgi:hypothetical protein